jgi:hypothetical protein
MSEDPLNPTPPSDQAAQAPSMPLIGNGHLERLIRVELQVAQLTDTFNESKKDRQATSKDIDGVRNELKELDKKVENLDKKVDLLEAKMDVKFSALNSKFNILLALIIPMFATIFGGVFLYFFTK